MGQTRMHILIADDDDLIRELIATVLEEAGFEVLVASDGKEACRLLDDPDHVALIITDLNMPVADGLAVATCARAKYPRVPLLFISGRPDLVNASVPQHRYLAKPFRLADLVRVAEDMVASRPGA